MDPLDFLAFNHQYASLKTSEGEKTYHYIDQKPKVTGSDAKPLTLLLIHGFPDLWYGWRHQIGPWVDQGYRVIAPDCAGYGGSAKPDSLASYTPRSISRDLVSLLDHLQIDKVVVVAHDWGAAIAWRFCAFEPERVTGLVAASVPFNPPARRYMPLSEVALRTPTLGYMEYFSSPSAIPEIESRLLKFFNLAFYRSPSSSNDADWHRQGGIRSLLFGPSPARSDLMGPEEMEVYLRAFSPNWEDKGSGMRGPLAYYKTGELRVDEEKHLPATLPATLPILFVHPLHDPTCLPSGVERMQTKFIPHVRVVPLECGHWVMLEKPDEVTKIVIDFVESNIVNQRKAKL